MTVLHPSRIEIGARVEVRRGRRRTSAFVAHLAERYDARCRPLPYFAPEGERQVGLAVPDGEGGWRPAVAHVGELHDPDRPERIPVHEQTERAVYRNRALASEATGCPYQALAVWVDWIPGRSPQMVELREEVRRLGVAHGYPGCCTLAYRRRPATSEQRRAGQKSGYLPCPMCADAVLRDMADGTPGPEALRRLLRARAAPYPLAVRGDPGTPDPGALQSVLAWRQFIALRTRRVEFAMTIRRFRPTDDVWLWAHPLLDRMTRELWRMRWLLREPDLPYNSRVGRRLYTIYAIREPLQENG